MLPYFQCDPSKAAVKMTNLEVCISEEEVCEQVGVIVEVDRLVLLLLSLQFSTFSSYEETKYIFAA
jgi:hypothetical protein